MPVCQQRKQAWQRHLLLRQQRKQVWRRHLLLCLQRKQAHLIHITCRLSRGRLFWRSGHRAGLRLLRQQAALMLRSTAQQMRMFNPVSTLTMWGVRPTQTAIHTPAKPCTLTTRAVTTARTGRWGQRVIGRLTRTATLSPKLLSSTQAKVSG